MGLIKLDDENLELTTKTKINKQNLLDEKEMFLEQISKINEQLDYFK